jgi:SAM-dependent methyltransferase
LKFELRTAQEAVATEHADVVVAIDLFHHLSAKEQLAVVQSIHKLLATGGLFLLKDLGVVPRWKYYANYLHDFLRNPRDRFHFRSRDNFVAMLRTAGFSVEVVPMPKAYLAHLLFVCRKD